jgi:carbon-monoxide dehydrogenase medium subunit
MKYFDYLEPSNINEAISLLLQYGDRGKAVAGGTDLIVKMKRREIKPDYLINLKGILDINYVKYNNVLQIGSLTTINSIDKSPVIKENFLILSQSAHKIGSPQVRNIATIGGNICNASPSADMIPSLMVSGAMLKIIGPDGEKKVPIERFFTGPSETILSKGEILTSIEVPRPSPGTKSVYIKHSVRRAMDLAIVGIALAVNIKDGICEDIKIGLGAVAPTPIRAYRGEEIIRGKEINDELIEKVAEVSCSETSPISDIRGSAEYRREMVKALIKRGLKELIYGGEK